MTVRWETDAAGGALLTALKGTFGYDTFRPLQEETVRTILAGPDACVPFVHTSLAACTARR